MVFVQTHLEQIAVIIFTSFNTPSPVLSEGKEACNVINLLFVIYYTYTLCHVMFKKDLCGFYSEGGIKTTWGSDGLEKLRPWGFWAGVGSFSRLVGIFRHIG